VAVAINLTKKVDVDFLRLPAEKKKKCDSAVDEARGLLSRKNIGKKLCLLHIWRICGE
jgi:hypothetical protein